MIDTLIVGYVIGTEENSRAFVAGGNTPSGRALIVNNVRTAQLDKELPLR